MSKQLTTPNISDVLVYVGGDLVGDALMKLPFVRALRSCYPKAHIAWCAGKHKSAFAKELAPLVNNLIDEVIEEAGFDKAFQFLWRRPLNGRHFDLVIDTQRGIASSCFVWRIRHQIFVSGAANFLFSDRKPAQNYQRPVAMVQQMLDLLAFASCEIPNPNAKLSLPQKDIDAAAIALPAGPIYIGIAPGAGGRQKCWPLDRFIALAKHQITKNRRPVFFLGPAEAAWAEPLIKTIPDAIFPTISPDGRPLSSVSYSIALGQRISAAVANDAGGGHILAAADAPLISLFGPTLAAKFAPKTSRLLVIDAQSFGGNEMTAIPFEAVISAIDDFLVS